MRVVMGFSTRRGNPGSWLIRRVSDSSVSHAWFLVQDPVFSGPLVWEAGLLGFHPEPAERFWRKNHVLCTIALDLPPEALGIAREWMGTYFDVPGLFGALVPTVGKWCRLSWHNPFESPDAVFCSEVIARILRAANFPGADALDPDDVSPQDILDFLSCWAMANRSWAMALVPRSPEAALEVWG